MKTLLLIDNNGEARNKTAKILALANYNVLIAEDAKEGISLAKSTKPHLIICDITIPDLDGYGIFRILSSAKDTAHIPFIFLISNDEPYNFKKAMLMGVDGYIPKPFDDLDLLNIIEARIRRSEICYSAIRQDKNHHNAQAIKARNETKSFTTDPKKLLLCKRKQIIYSEGTYVNNVFFLHKGKVKIYKTNEVGNEYITDISKSGDFLGYHDLFDNSHHSDSAAAIEESEIYMIPKEEFLMHMYSDCKIAGKFMQILSKSILEKEERLLQLAYNSVRKRVAQALLMLEKNYANNLSTPFSMSIPREDLASMVGSSHETVIRTLSEFKCERMIEIKGSNITILDSSKLFKIKN